MGRPTKEERTCLECGSTNTFRVGYKTRNRFVALTKRFCLACGKIYDKE